ncbi:MAG: DUF1549 domain-containing protein [Bryobacterales bacterium]|nr:DUF1549 domain-containing protein [Bryobacterales bacterium]
MSFVTVAAIGSAWIDKDDQWVASRKGWWAFQKPVRPEPPAISDPWVKTPIDQFILEGLRAKNLQPSPRLDNEKLVRRLYLDLTGLPPTPAQVDEFLNDKSPKAYENLVDRLMSSQHYGERWGQKWLDVVRYADTNGFEADGERKGAWRYRDYVVKAFNSDKPYDRFVKEQLAGDELYPGNTEALIATGFHRMGPQHIVGGNTDPEMTRQEVLTEMTATVGGALLGLTVNCARCHNHKFDPIPQADYYRLQAVLAATEFKEIPIASEEEKARYEEAKKAFETRLTPMKKQIDAIEKPYRERIRAEKLKTLDEKHKAALDTPKDRRTEEQKTLAKEAEAQVKVPWDELLAVLTPDDKVRRAELRRQMHRLEYERPEPPATAYAVVNMEKPPSVHILKVGNHNMKLDEVHPGFLRVISNPALNDEPQGRRSALAAWIADPSHPLTARVMVNRIWQLRMGTGIVRTPNDYGLLGSRPTNQKLLDWMATEFMAKGWSVKTMDRMILLSSVYQQSTDENAAGREADPENKLYWHANKRRLEAEFLRDSVLAVSGALNDKIGGKPVRVPIEREIYDLIFTEGEPDNLWPVNLDVRDHNRRSLYLLNKRTVRLPMLANFDQPDTMSSCPIRPTSTHALQALSLMNSDFMQQQSKTFAARLTSECGANTGCAVSLAYKLAVARAPRPAEMTMAEEFFQTGSPLEDFCLALLNRNEFVYVP